MTQPDYAKQVIETPAKEELSHSFLEYSMSVVYSRALPSIDGLKPVQRRILYGMHDAGWTHDKNYVKVSRVAGEVMGKFHPHGDSSISDALVKLAQPFYSNIPFIDGYGNFGDVSGSPAAAARYIECKLSKAASYVLPEIKENTVDMRPNYDGTEEEPALLPVKFPTLLVNGNFGIGVGFSNKMPSHNLSEVIEGTKLLLRKPTATLEEVMKLIPGPDFPTGAEIIGLDGIKKAYETGQGVIRLRAKTDIVPIARGKHELVFTELPYGVRTETIISKIKDALKEGKLEGLADAKDLTDRNNGLKIVVETKAGVNPQALLVELYKETQLEDSFGINNTVLVEGHPKVLGLLDMLQLFIDFRKTVVRKRSEHRKLKREERLHLVNGLLKALANIDEVIKIVRAAEDANVAQQGLIKKFKVDEIQADYILGIALRRLTKFDTIQLSNEKDTLEKEIEELKEIINNETVLTKVIVQELNEVKKELGVDRKSIIIDSTIAEHRETVKTLATQVATEVEDGPCYITLLANGNLTRTTNPHTITKRGKINPILTTLLATHRGKIVVVTSRGNGYRLEALHLSEGILNSPKDLGITLAPNERIIAIGKDTPEKEEAGLALGTKNGIVKIVNSTDYPLRSDEFTVMNLADDDEIIGGGWVSNPKTVFLSFLASNSSLLRFDATKVRPQGRSGGGVAGIRLSDGEQALAFAVTTMEQMETADVVTVTNKSVKRSKLSDFPTKGRATGGVRSHTLRKGEGPVEAAVIGNNLILVSEAGKEAKLPPHVRRDASGENRTDLPTLFGSLG